MSDLTFHRSDSISNKHDKTFYGGLATTSYEKVMNILRKVQDKFNNQGEDDLAEQIAYVIKKIETNSLYSINIDYDDSTIDNNNNELKNLVEFEFSETKRRYQLASNLVKHSKHSPTSKRVSKDHPTRFKTIQLKSKTIEPTFLPKELITIKDEEYSNDESNSPKTVVKPISTGHQNERIQLKTKSSVFLHNPTNIKSSLSTTNFAKIHTNDFNLKHQFNENSIVESIKSINFNIHDFYNKYHSESFVIMGVCMFDLLDILCFVNQSKLANFLEKIRDTYNPVLYHNEKHGIDVGHSIFTFITIGGEFEEKLKINKLDIICIMAAAICHDVGHHGFNNNFHINSLSSYAVTYNDKSVMENFHAAESMRVLLRSDCNFLDELEKTSFKRFRKFFVEAILATDMTFHAKINTIIKTKLSNNKISSGKNIENLVLADEEMSSQQQEIINYLMHTADLTHNARRFDISNQWVTALYEEFWNQGDAEKSLDLPTSFLCDRDTADIPKDQVGFLSYIILPTFSILSDLFPNLQYLNDNVNANIEKWRCSMQSNKSLSNTLTIMKSPEHRTNRSIGSVSSILKTPVLIFQTHFTSINLDGESISD